MGSQGKLWKERGGVGRTALQACTWEGQEREYVTEGRVVSPSCAVLFPTTFAIVTVQFTFPPSGHKCFLFTTPLQRLISLVFLTTAILAGVKAFI